MELNKIAEEIRGLLEIRRTELDLVFTEDDHKYTMRDLDGNIRSDYPSVSKIVKKFYPPFDAEGKALQMSNGDPIATEKLLNEWKAKGDVSTNLGSRTHFLLEQRVINDYGGYKELRQPIFECAEDKIIISDKMVGAGIDFLELLHKRGAVLLDTEAVLGDNELEYTGQPDNIWLIKDKNDNVSFFITDWKTNQPKNFEKQWFTKQMKYPFNSYPNTALSHYYLQLPLYGRLLIKMLQGTKYENIRILGSIVVLLKEDGTFQEYRVPMDIVSTVLELDLNTVK
jgi:hypothetical protein